MMDRFTIAEVSHSVGGFLTENLFAVHVIGELEELFVVREKDRVVREVFVLDGVALGVDEDTFVLAEFVKLRQDTWTKCTFSVIGDYYAFRPLEKVFVSLKLFDAVAVNEIVFVPTGNLVAVGDEAVFDRRVRRW